MAIEAVCNTEQNSLIIKVKGRFDFNSHKDFRQAYESCGEATSHYVIDMEETSYLDSSALGMLLLLRDFAGGEAADVVLTNCNPDVRKILNISNFEMLFQIQ